MQINTCLRCNRSWCYRGTGRATRCGVCKSPYWDRPNSTRPPGDASPAGMPDRKLKANSKLSSDILRDRRLEPAIHRSDDDTQEPHVGASSVESMGGGSVGSVAGMEISRPDPTERRGEEADTNIATHPQHSAQVKAALRAICAGKVAKEPLPIYVAADFGQPFVKIELCPHKEWAEDGEQYRCRLQAGHKRKCMPGERVSA